MTRYEGARLVIEATAFAGFFGTRITLPAGALVFGVFAIAFTVTAAVLFAARETT